MATTTPTGYRPSGGGQIVRLEQLTQMLDEAQDLIISHRVPDAAR